MRLVRQLHVAAAAFADAQRRARFAEIFALRSTGVLADRTVGLDDPCERWLVWPEAAGRDHDARAAELAGRGIKVVSDNERGGGFRFMVGPPAGASSCEADAV